MLKEVIKRNGRHTKFVANKINIAIQKANNEVSILDQASDEDIKKIVKDIKSVKNECIHIEVVQDLVETGLMQAGKFELAKKYMLYRYKHKLARDLSEAEASVLGILDGTNLGVIDENSNKNSYVNSTQRDLMAGEVSRTIAKKILLPDDIRKADEDMEIHWHDIDYTVQSMINCFGRETRFLTTSGVRSFEDFNDGDIVEVFSHTGAKRRAVVHNYGRQKLYNITFKRGKDSFRTIRATRNHRWLLLHGSQTTNLSVGDAIATPPVIDSFNLAECDPYLYEYWCIGFALGDGSDYDNSRYGQSGFGISVRLCGRKKQYNDIFDRAGFNCTQPESLHGDYRVYMPKYSKEAFLRNKSWRSLSVEQQIALFNGYICADGEFRGKDYPTGISTINSDIESMVYELAELSGYYIGASRVVTGSTNFVEERKPLTHIQFAREFYCRHPYKCYSIEEDVEEDVWCLEVEEDKSFLLEGGLVTGNCCLINIKSILDDGTVMSDYLIASPKSFRTACSIVTQVVAIIASNQYGGQSIAIKHLGKYLAISRERFRIENRKRWEAVGLNFTEDQLNAVTEEQLKYELEQGVQTIQYQFQTLVTTNGQSPFVTLFMQLDENDPYLEETAMIIEEILKQRLKGVMNKDGKYITPSFPKLIYVLDENNCLRGGKYDYLTHLAAKCTIKRSYPDYISAKKMREQFNGEVFSCMGCRSFLSPWRKTKWYVEMMNEPDSEIGKYLWEGRFNQGVVTINLPQIGIIADHDMSTFWSLLDERLAKCYKALLLRHKLLEDTLSDTSPLHWQFGGIARLPQGESINKLLHDGFSTLSLGYIGIYETVYAMLGVSHTTPEGKEFALKIMHRLADACETWKKETNLGFGLYGTPAESLCYKFCKHDAEKFGIIENVTDKGYYTNSYHIDVREEVNAFEKFEFESEFQPISSGGCISYVEIPNLEKNQPVVEKLITYIYDHVRYGEFNSKSDYCFACGFQGQIDLNKDNQWECPCCHNKDMKKMYVSRRTCGYLGSNEWNEGKRKEIGMRVEHL